MSDGRPRLGDLLVDLGFIDEAQLEEALAKQRREGGRLGKILVDSAIITEDRLVHALARQLGIDSCDPVMTPIHPKVLELIPKSVAYRHRVLSLARKRENESEVIYVAMADPLDTQAMEAVRQQVGPNVRLHWMLAGETEMELALEKHLGAPSPTSDPGAHGAEASTYQGVPVVQGLPLGRDLPPRRGSSVARAPSSPPSAPPEPGPPDPFAPLAPGAELSPTGSIDQAFEGAFAEAPEEEIPAEAFEEVDPFEDDPPGTEPPGTESPAPRLPTSDLEVLAEDESPEEHELEPIPLDRFAERSEDAPDEAEPGLQTLEGEAIEELPDDAADEPDAISEPYGEPPRPGLGAAAAEPADGGSGALPPLGPFPSEALGAGGEDPASTAERAPAPPAPSPSRVGPPVAPAGPPTWGDLLGGAPPPQPSSRADDTGSSLAEEASDDAAEAPTPPPDVDGLEELEVEPVELEPLDDGEAAAPPPAATAAAEATEPPELELEAGGPASALEAPRASPSAGPVAAGPEARDETHEIEALDPAEAPGVVDDPSPVLDAHADAEADDDAGDTRPLEPMEEVASGSAIDDAEPSPWSDRDTTAGLELEPAPADPGAPPSDSATKDTVATDDLDREAAGASADARAEANGSAPRDGADVRAHLDRFLAGESDAADVAWCTRLVLEILRDADMLSDERLERAAARLQR